jgi:MFS transporter, DHA1 family, multidrug resistance protein
METLREAPLGQIVRFLSRNKLFRYPEEQPGFQIPFERLVQQEKLDEINKDFKDEADTVEPTEATEKLPPITHAPTAEDNADADVERGQGQDLNKLTSVKSISRTQTTPYSRERFEMEQELGELRTKSLPIEPVVTSSGQVLVTWYATDDQANPQNWSRTKKAYCSFLLW